MRAADGRPSILAGVDRGWPPCIIAAGGPLDPVRDDAAALAQSLRRFGKLVAYQEYPPLIHGFGNLTHVSFAARAAVAELGGRVGEVLRS